MLIGPTMNWPDSRFSFRPPLQARVHLYVRCAVTSIKSRFWLGHFRKTPWWRLFRLDAPNERACAEEISAWQFYLDHRLVSLNYLLAILSGVTFNEGPASKGLKSMNKQIAEMTLRRMRPLDASNV
jgi:hypothetical protein